MKARVSIKLCGNGRVFVRKSAIQTRLQVLLVLRARTQPPHTAAHQTHAIGESLEHCACGSFTPQRSFHLFILGQERADRVCTVYPQIKHSLCIPDEMYLLRFGRGGRQVLGYIK